MSHGRNVTTEGPNANKVNATAYRGQVFYDYNGNEAPNYGGQLYVYNDGDWVSAHVKRGMALVENYGRTVGARTEIGTVVVCNHGEAVDAETFNGSMTIQSDRGNVKARTRCGTIDVTIQAQSYSGKVQVEIDRWAGLIQVTINGSASQAQVTVVVVEEMIAWISKPGSLCLNNVVVGVEMFTKTIESGSISVSLTEQELVINEQSYEVRPSRQGEAERHQQQPCHPRRRRWYDPCFWRFGRQRSGRS